LTPASFRSRRESVENGGRGRKSFLVWTGRGVQLRVAAHLRLVGYASNPGALNPSLLLDRYNTAPSSLERSLVLFAVELARVAVGGTGRRRSLLVELEGRGERKNVEGRPVFRYGGEGEEGESSWQGGKEEGRELRLHRQIHRRRSVDVERAGGFRRSSPRVPSRSRTIVSEVRDRREVEEQANSPRALFSMEDDLNSLKRS